MNDDQHLPTDGLGDLLTHELHRRADGWHGRTVSLDDVRSRATSIRRRRAAATALGVAAVAAVLVPTAVLATRGDRADVPRPATVSPSLTSSLTSSQSPPRSATVDPHPHRLDVADLPTGAPPSLVYVTDADTSGISAFVQIGSTTVRVVDGAVEVAGPDGLAQGLYATDSTVVRNEQGTIAAWVTSAGEVMAWQDGQADPLVLGAVDLLGPQVAAVTGYDCQPAGRCSVWVSGSDPTSYEPISVTVSADGTIAPADPEGTVKIVRDATETGQVLGATSLGIDGSCSAVLNAPGSPEALRFRTCRHELDAFSASARYVLASEPYHSGAGSGVIAVYDAQTGRATAARAADGEGLANYAQATWEDDTHVLFTAHQDGMWSIVRMGVDGQLEYAVAPVDGGDTSPFVLETR